MNKDKTLFLIETDPSNIFTKDLGENGYHFALFFKEVNTILRAIRRIWIKLNLPCANIWFDNWFNNANEYDCLIINVNRLNHKLFNYILDKYPKIRIIGWYWNTVDESNYPINYNNSNIEYWSFDENDCLKHDFKKNIQYYSYPKELNNTEKEYDIYFIGRDKGRKEIIDNFYKLANGLDLKCKFNIVNDSIVPYEEVKKELAKSKAVLEINKNNQIGYTLRTLESLFFGIKLITNNKSIIHGEFYNKNNIFILEEDDINNLKEFINSPYDHSVDKYKEQFNIDKWFENFDLRK